MSRTRTLAIARRILQGFRRDRRTLALLFIAPIVILSLFDFLLRGGASHPAVGIVNEDTGPLGGAVAAQLLSSPALAAETMDRATADARLGSGEIVAYIAFPAGFTAETLQRRVIAPDVHLEGTDPGAEQAVLGALPQALLSATASVIPASIRPPAVQPSLTYLHGGASLDTLDYFGAGFVGLLVFFMVFVITSVSFLRERSQGTLERLMSSPLRRAEIVVGYMLGFTVVAVVQSIEVLLFALYVLKVYNAGNVLLILLVEVLMVVVAVNLGIFLSMFARTEFQAVQFIPLVIVPQVLLSGIIVSVSAEPGWLQPVSRILPLTYAVDGLRGVMLKGAGLDSWALQLDLLVVLGFAVLIVAAAATTLRRRVA